MKNNQIAATDFTIHEIEHAKSILEKRDPLRFSDDDQYYSHRKNCTLDINYDGSKVRHGDFQEVVFEHTNFIGTAGANTSFKNCDFYGCMIKNAGLRSSNFGNCNFFLKDGKGVLINTSFDNSIFDSVSFIDHTIEGCSFVNIIMNSCKIIDLDIRYCDFEDSIISHTEFKNMDFSHVGFNYVEFISPIIKNVIFPYFDMIHSFYGLEMIEKNQNDVYIKFADAADMISGTEYLKELPDILPYFSQKKDYFALANICIFLGKQQEAYQYVLMGLRYSLIKKEFKTIRYLCQLASYNHFFTQKQLNSFYDLLQSHELIAKMNTYEYKIFLHEMNDIKRMLVDNPFGNPQVIITLYTNIQPDDYISLGHLLETIDNIIDAESPHSNKYLSLRHNSPDILELFISDNLQNLIMLVSALGALFFGTTKFIKELQTI